jgi:hypothetical protein
VIKRREFIAGLGAVAWPVAAWAQQPGATMIGYLTSGSPAGAETALVGFRKGLSESGYIEGTNLTIEYRWANSDFGRLPELANDLVRRRVAVIAAAEQTYRQLDHPPPSCHDATPRSISHKRGIHQHNTRSMTAGFMESFV